MKRLTGYLKLIVPALVIVFLAPHAAYCNSLALTSAGTTDGFTLTTFATTDPGNTGCCNGPFGVAVTNAGSILVATGAGPSYQYHDVDGQTTLSAISTFSSSSYVTAFATAGGQAYGSNGYGGQFVEFNSNGSINHVLTCVTAATSLGMWGNPVNGHIIASSSAGLIDINPLGAGGLGTFRVINSGLFPDGVTVSPDGLTAYVENGGTIQAYSIATGALITTYSSFGTLGGPDGSGVITSTNSLTGTSSSTLTATE